MEEKKNLRYERLFPLLLILLVSAYIAVSISLPNFHQKAPSGKDQLYKSACELYKKDIYVRKLSGNPPYPCYMECNGISAVAYCPEEMYIQAVIIERAKELLGKKELSREEMKELYLIGDAARDMYRALREGNEKIAADMAKGALTTAQFVFDYNVEYRVLSKFLAEKRAEILKELSSALRKRTEKES